MCVSSYPKVTSGSGPNAADSPRKLAVDGLGWPAYLSRTTWSRACATDRITATRDSPMIYMCVITEARTMRSWPRRWQPPRPAVPSRDHDHESVRLSGRRKRKKAKGTSTRNQRTHHHHALEMNLPVLEPSIIRESRRGPIITRIIATTIIKVLTNPRTVSALLYFYLMEPGDNKACTLRLVPDRPEQCGIIGPGRSWMWVVGEWAFGCG